MKDPLEGFDWNTLYMKYDVLSQRYCPNAPYLGAFSPRPPSERELYYCLVDRIGSEKNSQIGISLGTYEALLYWKYYSQPLAIRKNCERVKNYPHRGELQSKLTRLTQNLPNSLNHDTDRIIEMVKCLEIFELPCINYQGSLPTRTTLLHMIYPDVVPIFDSMVLRAVGIEAKYANRNIRILREYIPFAWDMATKYLSQLSSFTHETPLRLIDMALWVTRGSSGSGGVGGSGGSVKGPVAPTKKQC